MWETPVEIEDAVYAAARDVIGDAALTTGALVPAILDRSARYTTDRDRLAKPADPTADLAARAAFFTVADAMKVAIPVGELLGRGAIASNTPLRIVDVGAGCGAQSLGLAALLRRPLAVSAIDRDAQALAIAERALGRFRHVSFERRTGDATTMDLPPAELVVMGGLLNELSAAARLGVVQRALAAIGPDGAVIIVEPALRDSSRALHELRDTVLSRGLAHVFAPCTRRQAPCPSLRDPDDWCHEDRAVRLPPRTAELARLTHLRDGGMKFSYLVLRHQATSLVEAAAAWRVVSPPRSLKGKQELVGCSDAGLWPIRLLRRNRSSDNRAFERANRGDVLVLEPPFSAEPLDASDAEVRVEISRETRLQRLEPAIPCRGA